MRGLRSAFPDQTLGSQHPVHGRDRRHVSAGVEENRPDPGRGKIDEVGEFINASRASTSASESLFAGEARGAGGPWTGPRAAR